MAFYLFTRVHPVNYAVPSDGGNNGSPNPALVLAQVSSMNNKSFD